MQKLFYFLQIIFLPLITSAQQYNMLLVPDSLEKNANAVNRYSEMHITILNEKKAVLYKKEVYTILNEAGVEFADYKSGYDKFTDINNLNGVLYNAAGKKIKEVKKKDIEDHPMYDGYSLMRDDRYKEHNFYWRDYPYTVEYEEEDNLNQLFAMPSWDPQISPLMSVEYSKLVVEAPADFKFRYKQFNLTGTPQITQSKNKIIYTWEVKNLTAKRSEIFHPSWREIMPSVLLAPSSFAIDDYQGNMDTWKAYGDFINALRKDKDILPADVKAKVHSLTDNVKDPKEKTDILYNYLQQNSRYVSVQLGVGGWQPFDANYVAANKYGDCKALSNYMVALLKEAGIKADYVLIKAGEDNDPIQTDFPVTRFNHATVCVPLNKDSVWLECTSQTEPPGYAGTFTGNRYALLIDENGGHIVSTPFYTSNDNKIIRRIQATVDDAGNLSAKINTTYTGCESDNTRLEHEYYSQQKIEENLKQQFDLPTYDVTSYNYKQIKNTIPAADEQLDITATNYATVMGKRMFIMPDIITHSSIKIDTSEKRNYDIVLNKSFKHLDSITIHLSKDYAVESLPKNLVLNSAFGNYKIDFAVNGNTITCTRYFEENAARFLPAEYKNFGNFLNTVYKADRSKIVFIRNEK